jgi:hypothetical protein
VRLVDETLGKTGPALDLGEQFGNPEARQHAVETPGDIVDIRVVLSDRADRQPRLGDQRLGKFASRGKGGHLPLPGAAALAPRDACRANRQSAWGPGAPTHQPFAWPRTGGARQQEVVEGLQGPAALEPDISGTKPIPKHHHHGNLPGATVNSRLGRSTL